MPPTYGQEKNFSGEKRVMNEKKNLYMKQSTYTYSEGCSISKVVTAMKEPVCAVLGGVTHAVTI